VKHLPTLKQLQYLIALAEAHSFSRAADACYVTQSTLSSSIANLEDLIGGPVVDRSSKGLEITPLGQIVLEKAHKVVMQTEDILSAARSLDDPLTSSLRIGVIPTIAPYILPLLMPEIKKQYPALDIKIFEDQSARILHKLKQGQLDLLLLAFPYDTEGLEDHILFQDPFIFAAPKDMATKIPDIVTIADMPDMDLLLLEEGHCLRDQALSVCKIAPSKKSQDLGATSLVTLIELVRHGFGCTLLPAMSLQNSVKIPNLTLHPFKGKVPSRDIGLAWRKKHPRRDEFLLFAKLVKESYQKAA